MYISRKTDYALRMLAELAQQPDGVMSARLAAEGGDVPYSFSRSIQHDLAQAGIVDSQRGAHGGMRLLVKPEELTLIEVLEAIQGPPTIDACSTSGPDGGPCQRMDGCPYNPLWVGAHELLDSYFSSVTLAQIIASEAKPKVSSRFTEEGGSGVTNGKELEAAHRSREAEKRGGASGDPEVVKIGSPGVSSDLPAGCPLAQEESLLKVVDGD